MAARPTLITGATGFAGSHLVDRLAGHRLIGWHRPGRSAPAWPGIDWRPVDIRDPHAVIDAIDADSPDRIYHLAGQPRVDTAWHDVVPHLETNVLGTHHVLEAVRRARLSCRMLVTSSALVYSTSEDAIDESTPLQPTSPYGISKLAQEQLALRSVREDGLDVVVARPFNHVGPRQDPSFAISGFARQIARIEAGLEDPVLRVGNLDAHRDLTDVRDVVDAYVRLMESGVSGRAYNVCSGRAVRIGDALDELLRSASRPIQIVLDEQRLRRRDPSVVVGNPSRIRTEAGWRCSRSLSETLVDTLAYWRTNVE